MVITVTKKGDSIKDYLRRAGGFSSFADPKDIFITYPNGNSQTLSGFISPKVLEGSTITVNSRKISGSPRGPSGWEAFSNHCWPGRKYSNNAFIIDINL